MTHAAGWGDVLTDQLRGIAGGMVVGIPFLYTMEVWWVGEFISPQRLLLVLVAGYVVVLLLSRTVGFHASRRRTGFSAALDAVEALALGIVGSTVVLTTLRVVTPDLGWDTSVARVALSAVPFAIGVALADQFVDRNPAEESPTAQDASVARETFVDVGATVLGAFVLSSAIGPTEEVPMLFADGNPLSLVAIVALSLVVSYALVFVAGFANQEKRRQQPGVLQRPITETLVSYLVSLVTAAATLWMFHNLALDSAALDALGRTIVLGFPAAVGGALGRIVV